MPHPDDLWVADFMHGPHAHTPAGKRRAILCDGGADVMHTFLKYGSSHFTNSGQAKPAFVGWLCRFTSSFVVRSDWECSAPIFTARCANLGWIPTPPSEFRV